MLRHLLYASLAAALVLVPASGTAAIIDLGHPTQAEFVSNSLATDADTTRGVTLDALQDFSITSAGIRFDPLNGGAAGLAVDIYASSLAADFSNPGAGHGALLATASIAIVDVGLAFYDVPIAFEFSAGTRYDIAFRALMPDGWGMGTNSLTLFFYHFAAPAGPYAVGPASVVDGFSMGGGSDGYGNIVMPHVRLDGAAVPEPAVLVLLVSGVVARLATRKQRVARRG